MTYAVIYADNADIHGTYATRADAVRVLREIVGHKPELADEVGLRPYSDGRPAGPFEAASDVLRDTIGQQQQLV